MLVASGINLFDTADSYGRQLWAAACCSWAAQCGMPAVPLYVCFLDQPTWLVHALSSQPLLRLSLRAWSDVNTSACSSRSAPHHICRCAAGTGRLNGRSEQLLGRFLDEYPGSPAARSDVRIATKLAAYPWRLTPKQASAGTAQRTQRGGGGAQCQAAAMHWLRCCMRATYLSVQLALGPTSPPRSCSCLLPCNSG